MKEKKRKKKRKKRKKGRHRAKTNRISSVRKGRQKKNKDE